MSIIKGCFFFRYLSDAKNVIGYSTICSSFSVSLKREPIKERLCLFLFWPLTFYSPNIILRTKALFISLRHTQKAFFCLLRRSLLSSIFFRPPK